MAAVRLELNFPNPIERPEDLFDRSDQLALIRETVISPARRIALIMGERVTGKTSLLNVVQSWAAAESGLAVLRLAPVTSRSQLIEEILEGMASEVDTSLDELGYRDANGGFTRSTAAGFAAVATRLSAMAGRTFLVCLDELDSMLVNCPDDQSATEILDFIMHVSNRDMPIKFVFTLTRATAQIMRADATPFTTAARIAELAPWTEQETREFVDGLLAPNFSIDDAGHDLLFAEAGGHPYLTKAILQRIVESGDLSLSNAVISAEQVRVGAAAALAATEVHLTIKNIVNVHISADELQVLQRLARATAPVPPAEFAMIRPALAELCRRHYVRPAGHGFVLAFRLLGRWLLAHAPAGDDGAGGHRDRKGIARLVLDEARRRVFLGDREIQLSVQEYRFVRVLLRQPGTVVDRAMLAAAVWPDESEFDGGRDSRLSALVYRLRVSLGDEKGDRYIETRRGFGFSAVPQNVQRVPGGEPS